MKKLTLLAVMAALLISSLFVVTQDEWRPMPKRMQDMDPPPGMMGFIPHMLQNIKTQKMAEISALLQASADNLPLNADEAAKKKESKKLDNVLHECAKKCPIMSSCSAGCCDSMRGEITKISADFIEAISVETAFERKNTVRCFLRDFEKLGAKCLAECVKSDKESDKFTAMIKFFAAVAIKIKEQKKQEVTAVLEAAAERLPIDASAETKQNETKRLMRQFKGIFLTCPIASEKMRIEASKKLEGFVNTLAKTEKSERSTAVSAFIKDMDELGAKCFSNCMPKD